jgi:hypothetical protein
MAKRIQNLYRAGDDLKDFFFEQQFPFIDVDSCLPRRSSPRRPKAG